MTARTVFEAWINPLQFLHVDEPWASSLNQALDEHAVLSFLCTPGLDVTLSALADRYREISQEKDRLFAVPAEPRILAKLVWPLRHAKAGYMLGNYLGTISLCGMVAEMVAIMLFEMSEIRINDRPLTPATQAAVFGRTFENLGQDRRVDVLAAHGTIDEVTKRAFDLIRTKRKRYLHLWSQDHEQLPNDARAVYQAAVAIVVRAIGQDIEDGKIRLNPQLIKYLGKSGVFEPLGEPDPPASDGAAA